MSRFGILAAILVSSAVVALGGRPAWMENLNKIENSYRANHSAPPLVMDDGLSIAAQNWANKLSEECIKLSPNSHAPWDKRIYKDGIPAGENLHSVMFNNAENANKESAADSQTPGAGYNWYKEVADYPWPAYKGQDLNGKQIFHFTQQVWNSTKLVGYGFGKHPKCTRVFFVARYFPPGNTDGAFEQNVFKRKSK